MTVLVTGAGIVGCQVARALVERGERPVLFDRAPDAAHIAGVVSLASVDVVQGDVLDRESIAKAIADHGITDVVNTAGLLAAASKADPVRAMQVNVLAAMGLLELARAGQLRRVVLCGSTTVTYSVFDRYESGGIPEDFTMQAVSQQPNSFYSATKMCMESMAGLYHRQFGVDAVVLRYGAVLGAWPGDNAGLVARLLAAFVVPAQRGLPAVIDDEALSWQGIEEFVDPRDCARGTLAALAAAGLPQRVYTLSNPVGWTFEAFCDQFRTVFPTLEVQWTAVAKGGFARFPMPRRTTSDITAAQRDLQWAPRYSLSDTIAYFCKSMQG